jgi:putative DNA methylase
MKLLIEDYMPIGIVGVESSREKSLWLAHPFTCHLWWARRPLVACRAVVYGALVPISRFRPSNGPKEKRDSLARANAAKFVERLCKYPGTPQVIAEAQKHILEAHAERLTRESGGTFTVKDILEGRSTRPKVLDMFAGAGAIPLEALRLGCEAYALDLNPVAHIIELCTLVYPQRYSKPDPNIRGMSGPKNEKGETTWGGLAEEVRYWGNWVLEKVKTEISDLYPLIPNPEVKKNASYVQSMFPNSDLRSELPAGNLVPLAYLWTRTVRCKNPSCGATVPLVKQTWLCRKKGRYIALKTVIPKDEKKVRFQVAEAEIEHGLDFNPAAGSVAGNAACSFCGTVADIDYTKNEGWAGRMETQLLAIVAAHPNRKGKVYVSADFIQEKLAGDEEIRKRIERLCESTGLSVPDELIANLPPDCRDNSLGITVRPYGFRNFASLFTLRQMLCLLTFTKWIREVKQMAKLARCDDERIQSVLTYLATALDREAENLSSLCRWNANAEKMQGTFGRQVITMVWDFCEVSPFGGSVGDWQSLIDLQINAIEGAASFDTSFAQVLRGSAMQVPWPSNSFDAVITDPPYYDNVPYADISDFFYVWLKRSIGDLYPEHFAASNTPKRGEAIADPMRHGGDKYKAKIAYEQMMAQSFAEANRVLKPEGPLVVVYAHKTTLGWATLIDALRGAGFTVTEAWPLDTEMKSRLRGMESSALASSIFLTARKRENKKKIGDYSTVRSELEEIVRERVLTLWGEGITGADLIIACVGAGLKGFTQHEKVELPNGEEVSSERFLSEVEGVVQETILEYLFGSKAGVSTIDAPTRFYILWRYAYGRGEIEAGEAIVFSYPLGVELDGSQGLSAGKIALLEKKGKKYTLKDFTERGQEEHLGLQPRFGATEKPLIDVLHRLLWLTENRTLLIKDFLDQAMPNTEELRLVAQALAGSSLQSGGLKLTTEVEQSALQKLLSNWRSVVEDNLFRKR